MSARAIGAILQLGFGILETLKSRSDKAALDKVDQIMTRWAAQRTRLMAAYQRRQRRKSKEG